VLLILRPTVVFGGASLLTLLVGDRAYMDNQLRQDFWDHQWSSRHAHAGQESASARLARMS
jgi:hypothetical protein